MDKDALIRPGERLDSLQFGDLCILQKLDAFRFGTDSVLLADFPTVRRGDYIVDLGTGSGIITILMASRHPDCRFTALEIQPEMAAMAARSMALNGLTDRVDGYAAAFRKGHRHGGGQLLFCVGFLRSVQQRLQSRAAVFLCGQQHVGVYALAVDENITKYPGYLPRVAYYAVGCGQLA